MDIEAQQCALPSLPRRRRRPAEAPSRLVQRPEPARSLAPGRAAPLPLLLLLAAATFLPAPPAAAQETPPTPTNATIRIVPPGEALGAGCGTTAKKQSDVGEGTEAQFRICVLGTVATSPAVLVRYRVAGANSSSALAAGNIPGFGQNVAEPAEANDLDLSLLTRKPDGQCSTPVLQCDLQIEIPAGTGRRTFAIPIGIVDDSGVESVEGSVEGFVVQLVDSLPAGLSFLGGDPGIALEGEPRTSALTSRAGARIIDDDNFTLGIAAHEPAPAYEGSTFAFPLSLTAVPLGDLVVTYSIVGEPVAAADFTPTQLSRQTVSFSRAQMRNTFDPDGPPLTIPVTTTDNTAIDGDRKFAVRLDRAQLELDRAQLKVGSVLTSLPVSAESTRSASATILDDDVTLALSGPSESVREGGTASFTVTRRGDLRSVVTVPYTVSGMGIEATDYSDAHRDAPAALSGTLTLLPATRTTATQTTTTLSLGILADRNPEEEEKLTVTLGAADAPRPSVPARSSAGRTLRGTVLIDSNAFGNPPPPTADGSASANVVIPGHRIAISITPSPTGVLTEGQAVEFTVTATGTTTQPVSFDYEVGRSGSNPADPDDFGDGTATTFPSGSALTIAAGENQSTSFSVQIFDDGRAEGAETFTVTLKDLSGGGSGLDLTPAAPSATATIAASPVRELRFESPGDAVAEGQSIEYRVWLTGNPPSRDIVVNWKTDGFGTNPAEAADFEPTSLPGGVLTFGAAQGVGRANGRVFTISTAQDPGVEGDEGFVVTVSTVSPHIPANRSQTATATIREDSRSARLSLSGPAEIAEGDEATYTVSVPGPITEAVTFRYAVDAPEIGGAQVTDFGDGTASEFPSGLGRIEVPVSGTTDPLRVRFSVSIDQDRVAERREVFTVTLSAAGGGGTGVVVALPTNPTVTTAIRASDGILISVANAEPVVEGRPAVFAVTATGTTTAAITGLSYALVPGTAGASDYVTPEAAARAFDIPAGTNPTAEIPVLTVDDEEVEPEETFTLQVVETPGGGGGGVLLQIETARATGTILDNEALVSIRAPTRKRFSEGTTAIFTIERGGGAEDEMVVQFSISGVDPSDYRDPNRGVVFMSAGQKRAEIPIEIRKDDVVEGAERMTVAMVSASMRGTGNGSAVMDPGARSATITISASLRVTASLKGPEQVREGEVALFEVSLAVEPPGFATEEEVVVGYRLGGSGSGDTAERDIDYKVPSGEELRIAPGAMGGQVKISVLRDALIEGVETMTVALEGTRSSAGSAVFRVGAAGRAQTRIVDATDEARRELRVRALLAATNRAAADMATDVISRRMNRRSRAPTLAPAQEQPEDGCVWQYDPTRTWKSCVPPGQSPPADARHRRPPAALERPAVGTPADRAIGGSALGAALRIASDRSAALAVETECSGGGEGTPADRPIGGNAVGAALRIAADSRAGASASQPCEAGQRPPRSGDGAARPASPSPPRVAPGAATPGPAATTGGNAIGTVLRLSGLSGALSAGSETHETADPQRAALLAGIESPAGPVETGPAPGAYGTDSRARGGELALRLPSFRDLLQGVDFELRAEELGWERLGEGVAIWASGGVTALEGDPVLSGQRLDYEGESLGLFLGADQRLEIGAVGSGRELLAGAALGWTRGDLDYTDRAAGLVTTGRFESELISLHPYASLSLSRRARLWVLAGYGWGDVKIEERQGESGSGPPRRVETDAWLWMVSAGGEISSPLRGLGEASEVVLRVSGTRTGGSVERARFADGELLRETHARTWRFAGEIEASHRIAFGEGSYFRPFVTGRLRGEAGDDLGDDWELGVDAGGGAELVWPDRGLSLSLRGTAQLNQGAARREHRVATELSYDLEGDGRGLTATLESSLEGSGRLGAAGRERGFAGGALGAALPGTEGLIARESGELGDGSLRPRIVGEIGYGLVARPLPWTRGLLTPYARLEWGARRRGYAAGLRFESFGGARLGIEAGVDFLRGGADSTAGISPDYQFLLTGELKF